MQRDILQKRFISWWLNTPVKIKRSKLCMIPILTGQTTAIDMLILSCPVLSINLACLHKMAYKMMAFQLKRQNLYWGVIICCILLLSTKAGRLIIPFQFAISTYSCPLSPWSLWVVWQYNQTPHVLWSLCRQFSWRWSESQSRCRFSPNRDNNLFWSFIF